jgi:hypothetical protein
MLFKDLATQPTTQTEDWGLIFSICQQVNDAEFGAKEARKALQKKLNSNVPSTQIHVFTVCSRDDRSSLYIIKALANMPLQQILKALTENSELRFRGI